ncbi:MAG TPA: hypothetical protein VN598_10095 [Usitatibacter sp.]|nr:hypothetical protein [Usitatibacter sp.]
MRPNHTLAFVAATLAALSLGACSKAGTKGDASRVSMAASPSAQLVGTTPAPASTQEPAGVTPVASDVDDGTKASEQKARQAQPQAASGPKEGDDSSHFTDSPGQKTPSSKDAS